MLKSVKSVGKKVLIVGKEAAKIGMVLAGERTVINKTVDMAIKYGLPTKGIGIVRLGVGGAAGLVAFEILQDMGCVESLKNNVLGVTKKEK